MIAAIASVVDTLMAFTASLPFPIMLLGATVLLASGLPVLVLLTGLAALQGLTGLVAALIALYAAAAALHLAVRAVRRPAAAGLAFPWLCIGAALVPFWPYVVLTSLRGARLRAIAGAIAVVSTPNFVLFALALVLGRTFEIHPLLPSAGAAGLAVAVSLLVRRRWSGQRDDFSPTAGVQRG